MRVESLVPGAAQLQLADGVPLLRPEEQVFAAMLGGWRTSNWPAICLEPGLMDTIKPTGVRNDVCTTEVPRRAAGAGHQAGA